MFDENKYLLRHLFYVVRVPFFIRTQSIQGTVAPSHNEKHSGVGGPVAPFETERLPPFFVTFLFRAAAAAAVAETMQRELVTVARAAIVKTENFMVVV